jgi:hypothetical protein
MTTQTAKRITTLAEAKAAWAAGNFTVESDCGTDSNSFGKGYENDAANAINTEVTIGGLWPILFRNRDGAVAIERIERFENEDSNIFEIFLDALKDVDTYEISDAQIEEWFPGIFSKAQASHDAEVPLATKKIAEILASESAALDAAKTNWSNKNIKIESYFSDPPSQLEIDRCKRHGDDVEDLFRETVETKIYIGDLPPILFAFDFDDVEIKRDDEFEDFLDSFANVKTYDVDDDEIEEWFPGIFDMVREDQEALCAREAKQYQDDEYVDAPETLDELFDIMRNEQLWEDAPLADGRLDWTRLPSFGGKEPEDTSEIWSWDETRMIVGRGFDEIEIVDRDAYYGTQKNEDDDE